MPIKETEHWLEFRFIGSQKKNMIAYNFHHLSLPSRTHFMEVGKKYSGNPLLFVSERKDGHWMSEDGKTFDERSPEHAAFETLARDRLRRLAEKILPEELLKF